ncbi:MAG: hypothetical protein JNL97_06780, partial [Verrucomicrobiales bacterium]|nr:hypothetical protein [Verrucomicrobiales bacterium]
HCGYDPSGALGTNYRSGDNWKNFKYNFWPKPAPFAEGHAVKAFNGVYIGKGHLAEAKAVVNRELAGAKSAFARGGNDVSATSTSASAPAGSCGSGDTSERDALLARIRENGGKPLPLKSE